MHIKIKNTSFILSACVIPVGPLCVQVVHPDKISGCPLSGFPEQLFVEFSPTLHRNQTVAEFLSLVKRLHFFLLQLSFSVFLKPTILVKRLILFKCRKTFWWIATQERVKTLLFNIRYDGLTVIGIYIDLMSK